MKLSVALSSTVLTGLASAGCYRSGNTFADYGTVDQLVSARTNACNSLTGVYEAGESRDYCAQNGQVHINFSAKNTANSGTLTLSTGDCLAAMTIEMNACSRGSEQSHGSFLYRDDPNAGSC